MTITLAICALECIATAAEATRKSAAAPASAPKDKKIAKLLVKNLAFEATKKDLRELFGAFGQLKVVRIPRKFDGSHRGFGFVEFLTHQEAVNAMAALSRCVLVTWTWGDFRQLRGRAAR